MPTKSKTMQSWLDRNRPKFGSADGLPGEFLRQDLFKHIRPGVQAGIVTCHGTLLSGRAVMVFHTHAVLNGGGAHGTPLIADARNTVYCAGVKL
jgi:hypothetical protein